MRTQPGYISSVRSSLTDKLPVIFLLKTEADILVRLMAGQDKRNVSITGGTEAGWTGRKITFNYHYRLISLLQGGLNNFQHSNNNNYYNNNNSNNNKSSSEDKQRK